MVSFIGIIECNSIELIELTIDYDAPLTEAGDYSDKYYAIKDLVARFNIVPNIVIPTQPVESIKAAYPTIFATQHLTLENLLSQVVSTYSNRNTQLFLILFF